MVPRPSHASESPEELVISTDYQDPPPELLVQKHVLLTSSRQGNAGGLRTPLRSTALEFIKHFHLGRLEERTSNFFAPGASCRLSHGLLNPPGWTSHSGSTSTPHSTHQPLLLKQPEPLLQNVPS